MPLGGGFTVEAQLTGKEDVGGVQLVAFEPKPGRSPKHPPRRSSRLRVFEDALSPVVACGVEMGLGAGGRMHQSIYPDAYGIDAWDATRWRSVHVHIANSAMWHEITGEAPRVAVAPNAIGPGRDRAPRWCG